MSTPIKVLVIDDSTLILDITKTLLTASGFDVRATETGTEGLDVWRQWKPDVVLLDLMMPEMSGWDVMDAAEESSECNGAQVIIFSAKDEADTRHEAGNRGAFAFLLKPFEHQELAELVREAAASGKTSPPTE